MPREPKDGESDTPKKMPKPKKAGVYRPRKKLYQVKKHHPPKRK